MGNDGGFPWDDYGPFDEPDPIDDTDWSDTESVDATEPRAVALDEAFENATLLIDDDDPPERVEDLQ